MISLDVQEHQGNERLMETSADPVPASLAGMVGTLGAIVIPPEMCYNRKNVLWVIPSLAARHADPKAEASAG